MTGPRIQKPLDDATKQKIVGLYRDHSIPISSISARYGRSSGTIKTILKEAGVFEVGRASERYI